MVKNLPTMQETGFDSWVGKIPWRREWQPTPLFLPGEFHEQKSLAGYSQWCHKESDTTEQLIPHLMCLVLSGTEDATVRRTIWLPALQRLMVSWGK